tara:strand:+ start:509 stop:691 length:183 start_codon:yes stop_codon:yes gene_type:complete
LRAKLIVDDYVNYYRIIDLKERDDFFGEETHRPSGVGLRYQVEVDLHGSGVESAYLLGVA